MALDERVRIRRVLTDTALARQHDRLIAGGPPRKRVEVPWKRFVRSRYPAPALALACKAQTMLAQGEYEAVDLFSRIAGALAVSGAPLDLVAAATRVATDEIRHADYAFRFAALLGGRDDVAIDVRSRRAEQRWGTKLDMETLDRMMIEIPAIGEGLACALLAASRERASDVVARPLYDSILADEVHHTRLGWYYLAWRAPQWSTAEKQRAADRAGEA
ncbi:MAG: ferritin-like domain-containing protein, partial [Polyangiaceae bacterium]